MLRLSRSVVALALAVSLVPVASGASAGVPCAWYVKTDADTFNVAFPDQSATYWSTQLVGLPGTRVVVRGVYPFARYMSLHVYDAVTNTVGSLGDVDIDPDAGSENPFRTAPASSDMSRRRYTVTIEFAPPPADPAPNTIYAGVTEDGFPNGTGALIYRIYVPDDAGSAQGSVGLPDVTWSTAAGDVPMSQCDPLPPSTGSQLHDTEVASSFPDQIPRVVPLGSNYTNPPTTMRAGGLDRVVWDRVPPNDVTEGAPRVLGTFYANDQAAYLTTRITRTFGDVVAYRFKAPTFPNTRNGDPVAPARQVRYWSLCQYEFVSQRYIQCAADYQSRVAADGYARFVISDIADRPAGGGFDWIPWGGLYYEGFIGYRQLLADPSYTQSIAHLERGADGPAVMGPYWPDVRYCAKSTIESSGFDACFG